jgi:hypothetical protein
MKQPSYKKLLNIAQEKINNRITTLRPRRSDSLDFWDVSVWGIEAALRAAYELGWKVGAGKDQQ